MDEYNKALADADEDLSTEQAGNKKMIQEEIKKHQDRKDNYQKMLRKLEQTDEPQISTSDPESRQLITRNNTTEVVYSAQTVFDTKHNLSIDYKVTNQNDRASSWFMQETLY